MISPDRFIRRQTSAVVSGTQIGPTVTASATPHTLGTWTSVITAAEFDVFLCGVTIRETFASTVDSSCLVNIGVDPAGGTSYTVEIPGILGAGAAASSGGGGFKVMTWFPCFFPKGSQIAAQIQGLVISQTAIVGVTLIGGKNRSNPFPHRARIVSYGADTATSGGTVMANAAIDTKGAWTQLGVDTTRRHSGLVVCTAIGNANVTGGRYLIDVGIDPAGGTTFGVVIGDVWAQIASTEVSYMVDPLSCLVGIDIPVGAAIAARAAGSAANIQDDLEVVAYGF